MVPRAEAEAEGLPAEADEAAPELAEQERRDVALNLVRGDARKTASPPGRSRD
ncbi:hypothetical protein [Streptomyces shenzhenensis]|uniref:hypothetical protein n=1 Tax=Streptomyces shenzhenensis TaxID=943815 RepID=UPI0015EFEDB0|nr:hypothetical protein [Streptomyces shenzhenensis]